MPPAASNFIYSEYLEYTDGKTHAGKFQLKSSDCLPHMQLPATKLQHKSQNINHKTSNKFTRHKMQKRWLYIGI